jgi:hypothetical protein
MSGKFGTHSATFEPVPPLVIYVLCKGSVIVVAYDIE